MTPNWMPEIRPPQVEGVTRPMMTSGGGAVPGRDNGFKTKRPRCCLCCYLVLTLSRHQAEGESLIHLSVSKQGRSGTALEG